MLDYISKENLLNDLTNISAKYKKRRFGLVFHFVLIV